MRFKITYRNEEGELQEETVDFEDTPMITAMEWAEDYAYTMTDKHWYEIEEI